jgi:hypothetical protein
MAMYKAPLPPNGRKLLALYLKPTAQWTEADERYVWQIVKDWTGDDHKAFAEFLRERL